jgi:nucleoside-diphosphate-sugar epimerase
MNSADPAKPGLPDLIQSEIELDEVLSRPRPVLVDFIRQVRSPLLLLGAGGKMGPTLAVLARRAAVAAGVDLRVVAVSRFSQPGVVDWLQARGVETLACDLLEREAVARLPQATDLIYLAGLKFGTSQNPCLTWAANTMIPANVVERFPQARLVALSTGNVYPLVPVNSGGASEDQPLKPLGEYAYAALARERLFTYLAQRHGASLAIIRLNYAVELRYGVLHDLARHLWQGQPVALSQGHFNCIWQRDANECVLRALGLAASPPRVLNLTGPNILSVRAVASQMARLLERTPAFTGCESETALLSNPAKAVALFGPPPTLDETMLRWTAHWVKSGGPSLHKPTHFEVRDGQF